MSAATTTTLVSCCRPMGPHSVPACMEASCLFEIPLFINNTFDKRPVVRIAAEISRQDNYASMPSRKNGGGPGQASSTPPRQSSTSSMPLTLRLDAPPSYDPMLVWAKLRAGKLAAPDDDPYRNNLLSSESGASYQRRTLLFAHFMASWATRRLSFVPTCAR